VSQNNRTRDPGAPRPFMGGMGPGGQGGPGHGGPLAALMPGGKAKDFKRTLKTFLTYLKPYRIQLLLVVFFSIGSTAFAIVGPKLVGKAITKLFEGVIAKATNVPGAAIDFHYIGRIVLLLIGLYVLSAILGWVQGFIMASVATKITYTFRRRIAEKIDRLPLKYFDTQTHGEVLSRVTNDVDTINMTLTQNFSMLISSVVMIIGVLIMMFSISWLMTLVALVILPVSVLFVRFLVQFSQGYFRHQQEYLGHMNGHVEEMYGGHLVVKSFNGEERSLQKFNRLNSELYKSGWKSQFLSGMMIPVMMFVTNLGYVAVVILGGYLAGVGTIGVGDILAFIQYLRQFTMPITQVANITNVLQSTAAAAERVFEFLDEPEEVPESARPIKVETVRGDVTFDHVHFGYDPERPVIHDFSADIKPGQRVAIVGPTGAGKTTIVKLLMRFYDVNGGRILIDGMDIRDMRREDLRRMFGMVLQDTWLFNGTIRENIAYSKPGASEEQIIAAARMAHVDHFIRTQPNGYDTEINEESSNISQGQKQLLTIARAFLADPEMLILDEATSSVDTRTEVLIQRAMAELMKDRTSFIIAHRLSTIRDAETILVMKDGDIVEQGKHADLLAANGFYASLYKSQFEAIGA
jgi:ATP-binding cassette, subfamily B, multidrug efflux pump